MLLGESRQQSARIKIQNMLVLFTETISGNSKPKAETTTRSKKVSFMAEEVSVSKFEYNDEDLDEVTETDEEQDGNHNDFNGENLVKTQEDPNVRTVHQYL